MKLRHLMLPAVTFAAGAGMTGTASAEGVSDGANVYEYSSCRDYQDGTLCSTTRGVSQRFQTPSGVYIINFVGQSTATYTDPSGCTWTRTFDKNEHLTIRNGLQEAHVLQRSSFTDTCSGEPTECVTRLHFHQANGGSQIHKIETTCTSL